MNWFIIVVLACFIFNIKSTEFIGDGTDINCPDGEDCTVHCNEAYACSVTINCPDDADCNIQCVASDACTSATLNWNDPTAGSGSLTCDGSYACLGVQFPTPSPDKTLNITCDSYAECYDADIVCPTSL